MKIETKFDVCDPVVFIYNDEIISRTIYAIEYLNRTIQYQIRISKGFTNLDKDNYVTLSEDKCFKTLKELYEYYNNIDLTK
jgi:hypothetical protein